ncbi:MAG: stage III sporulation protein AA, partial [Eubacteriales bacterium]|nr:stage III sporulation protein AA [Eubacteriales bacterium]
ILSKITYLCIRVAHEVYGCADSVMDFVYGNNRLEHTLIVSPPAYGKTTLLRDLVRQLSNGCVLSDGTIMDGKNVCIIDERSELAACFKGVPQNDVGVRTDVLDNCPKSEGMLMAVRALSPQVIAVDEIGGIKDVEAVMYCIHCGCTVFGTVHGWNEKELLRCNGISTLLGIGAFSRLIFLTDNEKHGVRCVEWREDI